MISFTLEEFLYLKTLWVFEFPNMYNLSFSFLLKEGCCNEILANSLQKSGDHTPNTKLLGWRQSRSNRLLLLLLDAMKRVYWVIAFSTGYLILWWVTHVVTSSTQMACRLYTYYTVMEVFEKFSYSTCSKVVQSNFLWITNRPNNPLVFQRKSLLHQYV